MAEGEKDRFLENTLRIGAWKMDQLTGSEPLEGTLATPTELRKLVVAQSISLPCMSFLLEIGARKGIVLHNPCREVGGVF